MPIDYSRYPAKWKTEIVPRILARAGHKCEVCSVVNGQDVFSVPLRVNDNGRYKVKRFWLINPSDFLRMEPFKQGGAAKVVKVVLTVAHLDHDETNHDVADDRLKAMCQYCHLNYDAKEKYRRAINKPSLEAAE